MGLVRNDDDVAAIGKDFVLGALDLGAELLDQGEDIAMVLAQKLLQVGAVLGAHALGLLGDRLARRESLVDLVVQVGPVGDDHEGPVAGNPAQDLLRQEHHGERLARTLRVPEHAQRPPGSQLLRATGRDSRDQLVLLHRPDGVVHAQKLMVLADDLARLGLAVGKQGEVLDQVEQPAPVARAAQDGF